VEARPDSLALSDWLEADMADWFVSHVGSMDFVTARYIKNARGTQ
jgi:hypothetical protein